MKKRGLLLFFMLSVCTQLLWAQDQEYATGLQITQDKETYEAAPKRAVLMTRDYSVLPRAHSLKKYTPTPKSQGSYGTCVGWSSTYAARTIVEAVQNGWTDKATITANAYAPLFTYTIIKERNDYNCQMGTYISSAMKSLQSNGAPKLKDYNVQCPSSVASSAYTKARSHKTKGYVGLWQYGASRTQKIQAVKKSLAENNPVVFGMKCVNSFFKAKGVWAPTESPYTNAGGHAMCVIGYDDNKYGGAFEIQNSWGTGWGNGGYMWIRYKDFYNFVHSAYELVPIKKAPPVNVETVDLSGAVTFELSNGTPMKVDFTNGVYRMKQAYYSGTEFRVLLANNEPAYVYALGSDATNKVFPIFPHKPNVSAYFPYTKAHVAIPDESHSIRMDNTVGTDYFCILYSKVKLDIEDINNRIERASGTFEQKVRYVLGSNLVSNSKISYSNRGNVSFSAKSGNKNIVAIIVKMEHR